MAVDVVNKGGLIKFPDGTVLVPGENKGVDLPEQAQAYIAAGILIPTEKKKPARKKKRDPVGPEGVEIDDGES